MSAAEIQAAIRLKKAAIRWASLPALKKAMFLRRLENEIRNVLTHGNKHIKVKTRKKMAKLEEKFMKKIKKKLSKLEDKFRNETGQGENEFAEMVETQCQHMSAFGLSYRSV